VPELTESLVALRALQQLPGVAEATDAAREVCTELRWHQALRRRIPQAAAESRVRGARASAALEGAEFDVSVVRDLMRGAVAWPTDPGPLEETLRGAVQVAAETEHVAALLASAPAQALARLHVAAATPLLPPDQVGRPRQAGEECVELSEVGPAPDPAQLPSRLADLSAIILASAQAPALVVCAIVHAEIAVARPFVRGNGLVARAMERAILHRSGLDPTGVAVPELGHGGEGTAGYGGALAAYASGSPDGVRLWIEHCGVAVVLGAREGWQIADAVLAGRLS
jgi:hypothetical protein